MTIIWKVHFSTKAGKQAKKMSEKVLLVLQLLINDLQYKGPCPGKEWQNYGKLQGKKNIDQRHCHLIKGNPTYVCCWEILDKKNQVIEVYYVGTHEKAPY